MRVNTCNSVKCTPDCVCIGGVCMGVRTMYMYGCTVYTPWCMRWWCVCKLSLKCIYIKVDLCSLTLISL